MNLTIVEFKVFKRYCICRFCPDMNLTIVEFKDCNSVGIYDLGLDMNLTIVEFKDITMFSHFYSIHRYESYHSGI